MPKKVLENYTPHNQRRLNKAIREVYSGQYKDWYDLAKSLQADGATYQQIADHFGELGVPVGIYTVHNWLKQRRERDRIPA